MTGPSPSRIVLVTTSFPQFEGDPSGFFVATEARRLQQAGHHVLVLAPGDGRKALGSDITVVGLGASSLFGWPGALPRLRERPRRALLIPSFLRRARGELLAHGPFDRAVLHFVVPCGWPIGRMASGALEIVAHGSDVRLLLAAPSLVRDGIVSSLLARGASFRFASGRLRSELLASLPSRLAASLEARSRVEPPPLDLPDVEARAAELRASESLDDGSPLWVTSSRLIPSKRVDRAIVEAHRRGARLVVVGDGPERQHLDSLARRLGAQVRFVGRLPHHEALAWIAAADRLLHTSEAEGAPTVIREARALGIPVLATATGDVDAWAETDAGIEILREA